ncbi:MAG: cupin domain-containing protein [Solirubrobacterales bacterium]
MQNADSGHFPRRLVTGHDPSGRSVVISDEPVPPGWVERDAGVSFFEIWNTPAVPAKIGAHERMPSPAAAGRIGPPPDGTLIRINEFAPGHVRDGLQSPIHRTETIDYGIVLAGEIVLLLDDSEVTLRTGDVVVQRGTDHAWANRTDTVARMAFILIAGHFDEELAGMIAPPATGDDAG